MSQLNSITVVEYGDKYVFEAETDPRPGYHTWSFEFGGITMQLMYTPSDISSERQAYQTYISYKSKSGAGPKWWPGSHIMTFRGHTEHAAVIKTLLLLQQSYRMGIAQGRADIREEFRTLMGDD